MKECIFCKIISGEIPSYKVYEDEFVYAFLDINPINKYHTLVTTKRHYCDIFDTPTEIIQNLSVGIKEVSTLFAKKLNIHNVQVINSSGSQAQQDVFHVHFHIVPRSHNDGNDIVWKTTTINKEELQQNSDALTK